MKTVIQKEEVLEKAMRTRYYFDIRSILDAMQKDGLIKPDGTLYSLFLRSRAEGKDCYQSVCDILEHAEELSLDRTKFKAAVSAFEKLEDMQKSAPDDFQTAYDMLYLKGEFKGLEPPLTNGELFTLASRAYEASCSSNCCYLHTERVEAVRVLLEFGTAAPRAIEGVPAMDADKMRSFLQTCDMDVFTTLVDRVSEENERFYSESNYPFSLAYEEEASQLNAAITAALEHKPPLSAQISDAAQRSGTRSSEPAPTKNMER